VDSFAWKALLCQKLSKFGGSFPRLNKNDCLIEFKSVNQFYQFPDFFVGCQLNIVLFQSVQSKLRVILNQYFGWIAQEFAAYVFIFL